MLGLGFGGFELVFSRALRDYVSTFSYPIDLSLPLFDIGICMYMCICIDIAYIKNKYTHIYMSLYIYVSLSLYIYVYIYIHLSLSLSLDSLRVSKKWFDTLSPLASSAADKTMARSFENQCSTVMRRASGIVIASCRIA